MYSGGRSIRAYRVSNRTVASESEELDQEIERIRQINVLRYAARVSAGLSVFGDSPNDRSENLNTLAV